MHSSMSAELKSKKKLIMAKHDIVLTHIHRELKELRQVMQFNDENDKMRSSHAYKVGYVASGLEKLDELMDRMNYKKTKL
jgi:hypothetical protein